MKQPTTGALALWVSLAMLIGCTEAGLQVEPPPVPPALDNLLSIEGDFCTEPSAEVQFPVKYLYIIDQSASLQCTDSQNRRFAALNRSINELRAQPNTSFAFIGFSSWSRQLGFTRNRDDMQPFLDPASGLGPATDYQGALATAIRILEEDMLATDGAIRARSRYVVIFVSDGNPEPRCLPGCEDTISNCSDDEDNDGDGKVDVGDEDCRDIADNSVHPDNLYGVCNTDQEIPEDVYVDFDGICPEYNQPHQIAQRIQELIALKDAYNIGDVSLHTVLLFSPQAVVESICPGASTAFGYDKQLATGTLQGMANIGNGTFRDVNLEYEDDGFLTFDISSIKAEQTLFDLVVTNQHARLRAGGLMTDADEDGLPDDDEVMINTERRGRDSDDDRYSDLFEVRLQKEGFDPLDPLAPAIPCNDGRDGDGDGLNDCEESFIGTDIFQPDTDGDNLTDWLELVLGTDPTVDDGAMDLDFDGVLNNEEIRGGTDPLVPDEGLWRAQRILYGLDDLGLVDVADPASGETEERRCYDYTIQRVQMAITPLPAERGLNRILLYSFEGPAQISGIPGEVKVACFEAFWGGGTEKNPRDGRIDVHQKALDELEVKVQRELNLTLDCPYFPPDRRGRGRFEEMIAECMGPKIQIGTQLLPQAEVIAMLRRHVRGDMTPALPERAFDLFVPIQNFSVADHCFRPWEFERLTQFLTDARAVCLECVRPEEEMTPPAGDGTNEGP